MSARPLLLVCLALASCAPQVRASLRPIRDTRLFVREVGPAGAPVLVVVHGGPGGNHLSLRPLEALATRYRVVFYDQRGTGNSDRLPVDPARPDGLDRLALDQNVEDLDALRKSLGQERIALVGHSWGGALAVFYAAAYPDRVSKLVVYSGGPEDRALQQAKNLAHRARFSDEDKALFKARVDELRKAVEGRAAHEAVDRLFLRVAEVMFPSLYCRRPTRNHGGEQGRAGFWASQGVNRYAESFDRRAFAAKVARITAPVLLTWGRCEPSPKERLTWLLDHLPDAQLVVFDKSGHNAMQEEPEVFFPLLRAFLDGRPLPAKSYRKRAEVP